MAETPIGKAITKFLDRVEAAAMVAKEIVATGKELVDLMKEERKPEGKNGEQGPGEPA